MKFTKLSLVAALLIGSSAFAIENIKVSGDVKVFYGTQDSENLDAFGKDQGDMFDQSNSLAEAALNIGVTADLTEGVSAGIVLTGISTLGLENNLVAGTFTGNVKANAWFNEAWLAGTYGKTTGKLGRMQLDTPLVFSETWSVMPSTFEAIVLMNQDIPGTTVVGAYVGKSNSNAVLGGGYGDITNAFGGNADARSDVFQSFYNGAYTIGAINNSFEPLTVQGWYYNAPQAADAYWLEANLDIEGITAGIQYTGITWASEVVAAANKDTNNDAFAAKLGYEMKDTFAISGAYSQVGKDRTGGMGAGGNLAGSQSKLYTEAWWYYGKITRADTSAYNVTVTAPVADLFDFGLYYTQSKTGNNGIAGVADLDFTEATFEVAKSFGPLDAGLYYIYTKSDDDNVKGIDLTGSAYSTVQLYLTYNF